MKQKMLGRWDLDRNDLIRAQDNAVYRVSDQKIQKRDGLCIGTKFFDRHYIPEAIARHQ